MLDLIYQERLNKTMQGLTRSLLMGVISVEAGNIGERTVLKRWDNLARGRPRVTPEARVRANSLVSSP